MVIQHLLTMSFNLSMQMTLSKEYLLGNKTWVINKINDNKFDICDPHNYEDNIFILACKNNDVDIISEIFKRADFNDDSNTNRLNSLYRS